MRAALRLALLATVSLLALPATARDADGSDLSNDRGRPKVELDRLDFPDIPGSHTFVKHLRRTLRRETRRADWGAGRGSTIEYRFSVKELRIFRQGKVLRVKCEAVGRLPKGKQAKSRLDFGGDPAHRTRLVERVLDIVARGVVIRLAEMERIRRGDLD